MRREENLEQYKKHNLGQGWKSHKNAKSAENNNAVTNFVKKQPANVTRYYKNVL